MTVRILAQLDGGDAKRAPTYRVRCPRCRSVCATTGYPREIAQRRACHACTNERPVRVGRERASLTEWARRLGAARGTLWHRIHVLGWTPERAVTTPVGGRS